MKSGEMKAPPEVVVIVINWNQGSKTISCLDALMDQGYPSMSVVVLDNGSVDDSRDALAAWFDSRAHTSHRSEERMLRLFHWGGLAASEKNLGFSGGANLAAALALECFTHAEYIHFLNNDTRPKPGALQALVNTAIESNSGLVGSVLVDAVGNETRFAGHRWSWQVFLPHRVARWPVGAHYQRVFAVEGSSILVRRDLIERRIAQEGNLFEPDFFMYGEEIDLCAWSHRAGYSVAVALDSVVSHEGAGSGGGERGCVPSYYRARNSLLLARRMLGPVGQICYFGWYGPSRLKPLALRVSKGEWSSAAALVRGTLDGYLGRTGMWKRHPLR